MGVCNCSIFCCTLLYVHSSIAIILMGKRKLIALFNLSSCCLVMVEQLILAVPWGCLRFVIVVFPDHTHLLFLISAVSHGAMQHLMVSLIQVGDSGLIGLQYVIVVFPDHTHLLFSGLFVSLIIEVFS